MALTGIGPAMTGGIGALAREHAAWPLGLNGIGLFMRKARTGLMNSPGEMTRSILALALATGALPAAAREPSPGALKAAIDPIVERSAFAAGFWGIEVRSLRSGRVLYSRNAGKNLKPASTMKLLTTAA